MATNLYIVKVLIGTLRFQLSGSERLQDVASEVQLGLRPHSVHR